MARTGSRRLAGARRHFRPSRYTRVVGWLRLVLPLTAFALIGVVALWPHLSGGYGSMIAPMIANGEIVDTDTMRMHRPRYVGRTASAEPYTVTAETATVDPADSDRIHLDRLDADLASAGPRDIHVVASSGLFHRASDELDMDGGIELLTSDGYLFETESARVDLQRGRVVGQQPIAGTGPTGDLEADRFEIREGGAVLHFEGRVKVTIEPEPRRSLGS